MVAVMNVVSVEVPYGPPSPEMTENQVFYLLNK